MAAQRLGCRNSENAEECLRWAAKGGDHARIEVVYAVDARGNRKPTHIRAIQGQSGKKLDRSTRNLVPVTEKDIPKVYHYTTMDRTDSISASGLRAGGVHGNNRTECYAMAVDIRIQEQRHWRAPVRTGRHDPRVKVEPYQSSTVFAKDVCVCLDVAKLRKAGLNVDQTTNYAVLIDGDCPLHTLDWMEEWNGARIWTYQTPAHLSQRTIGAV